MHACSYFDERELPRGVWVHVLPVYVLLRKIQM